MTKPPIEHFPIRKVCGKGRGTKATCERAPVLCGRCLQRVCGHLSGSSRRIDLETGEQIGYLDPRPYAITLGTCTSCSMKRGGWKPEDAIAVVREKVDDERGREENPPKKVLTGREVQDAISARTLKPLDVTTYRWAASEGRKGTQIYRKKWTRIRPGLYGRILGEYEVLVEECVPYESCPPGDRGWFYSFEPLASGYNLDKAGRSEDPVPTYKEAKTDAEREFEGKKVSDFWPESRLPNPAPQTNTALVGRLKF